VVVVSYENIHLITLLFFGKTTRLYLAQKKKKTTTRPQLGAKILRAQGTTTLHSSNNHRSRPLEKPK
jgi:hypothetical protein